MASSAIASTERMQWHYLPDRPGDAIFTGLFTPGNGCPYVVSLDLEIFSTAVRPHLAGLPRELADELKICLETQLADLNHTGCWDSSYLQIGL
ncbi:hypothetical protein [Burkholderia ambifaria]|uniref:hypothetical protein n=1 Tax=Burkholderia ambifaria TaxID=152480 RepID=UPI001B8E9540|nr:hypothetical protein [Burkholderia ambifaria]MBR8253773.1 hypothetical protein [Burkholderia ambifaria]